MADLTVTETTTRISYTVGSTAQTTFSVNFPFFQTKDLDVYVDGSKKSLTTDYSVTTVAANDGGFLSGEVVFNSGQSDCEIAIVRNITQERTTDFPPSGGFNIRELNRQLDQITAITQDLDRKIDQKIGFKETDFDDDVVNVSESASSRANKYIGFSSTGKSIVVKEGSTTGTAGTADSSKVPLTRKINTGTGLTGGGTLEDHLTLSLRDVSEETVTGTAYTNANITVDSKGRVISASSGSGTGGAGTNFTAGPGLRGGGSSNDANVSFEVQKTGVAADVYTYPSSIEVNQQGQVKAISSGTVTAPVPETREVSATGALTGGGALSSNQTNFNMKDHTQDNSLLIGSVVGQAQANASVTVDTYGRVTALTAGSASGLGWIKVTDPPYSASPNAADNAVAINAAIAALPSGGGVLYFPEGDFKTSAVHTIAGKPVTVKGAGMEVTKIRFTGTSGGFVFDMSGGAAIQGGHADGFEVTVSDMTLNTTQAGGTNNIALKFNGVFHQGVVDPSVHIDRVHIRGGTNNNNTNPADDVVDAYWYYGIYLSNCPGTKISNTMIDGQYVSGSTQAVGTEAAIYIVSTNKATEYHITNCNIFLCKKAMAIHGSALQEPEGFYISNSGFVANDIGIHGAAVSGALGLQVTNCHFNNKNASITGYFQQLIIGGNLFYIRPDAPDQSVCIQIEAAGGTHQTWVTFNINNNHFVNNSSVSNPSLGGSGGCYGIVIGTDGQSKQIHGSNINHNHFQWIGNQPCIVIRDNCRSTTVSGNSVQGSGTNVFHNSSNTESIICEVSKRAALYVPDSGITQLIHTRDGVTKSAITNNTIDLTPQTMAAVYDTGGLTGTQSIGSGGVRTVLKIPTNFSVRWVRVGAKASFSRTSAVGTAGAVYMMIKHYHSSGVHYKSDTIQGSVQKDFASNNGAFHGNPAPGLGWEGVANISAIQQIQSTSHLTATSGLVRVYPGDYFYLVFGNTCGVDVDLERGCQLWMEVIEGI